MLFSGLEKFSLKNFFVELFGSVRIWLLRELHFPPKRERVYCSNR